MKFCRNLHAFVACIFDIKFTRVLYEIFANEDPMLQCSEALCLTPNTPTSSVHKPAKRQPGLKGDLGARQAGSTPWIALCCYPNVNGSVRNLSLNHSSAPIFCYSIISEKIFGLQFCRGLFFFFTYL